ncbi:MAG: uroporphyrinogen decarboxylase [Rhodospirillales bacterium]|nr:uroporphyrinogen decarboxylase [Rhodospirillales bacterium]
MSQQTQKKLIRALNGETLATPPFWFMRQAGRYLPEYRKIRATARNFLNFCYTPDLAVEVTLQPLRRLHTDAAIMFSDILVVPDALGQQVEFKEGEGPVLEPIRNTRQLAELNIDRLHDHLSPVYEVLSRLSKEIPATTSLIGFAGAPWTLAIYMVEGRGGTECGTARLWDYEDQAGFKQLIDLLVDAVSQYLIQQVIAGAEVLQLFDSWSGVLSEDQFRRLVIEPNRRIVENVRAAHPHIPIIGFPRNAGSKYEDFARETRMNAVSIDHSVGLQWAKDHLQTQVCVQGNLDNHVLMAGGNALDKAVDDILRTLSGGPFIFNLGHGILPPTPPENVERVAELIRNWSGVQE